LKLKTVKPIMNGLLFSAGAVMFKLRWKSSAYVMLNFFMSATASLLY